MPTRRRRSASAADDADEATARRERDEREVAGRIGIGAGDDADDGSPRPPVPPAAEPGGRDAEEEELAIDDDFEPAPGEDEEPPAFDPETGEPQEVPAEELERALAAAAAGDEAAWRWIVDRYARRVFGLIHAQCGEPETAEEITQSAFCTVVAKIGEYTEQGRFEAWLFRIAMNRLRDEMRRRRRHAVPVEHETLASLAGGESKREAELGDADDLSALRSAMARLPEADRRVLHLRHAAGMSFKGMAEYLGQPLGTVLARHHRALRKLREDLAPRAEPDDEAAGGTMRPGDD